MKNNNEKNSRSICFLLPGLICISQYLAFVYTLKSFQFASGKC